MPVQDQEPLFLLDIEAYDPSIPGVRTLRYSTGRGFVTQPSESPANEYYAGRVRQALDIERWMFSSNATRGRSSTSLGTIELDNHDGALDTLIKYGFDGRKITVRRGVLGAAYPSGFTTEFIGTMSVPEFRGKTFTINLRDEQLDASVPMQPTKYTGAGLGTLEGTEDNLQGKPKPICYGFVRNITPPCVEPSKLIYQVSDGLVASIPSVYDIGIDLAATLAKWDALSLATAQFGTFGTTWDTEYGDGVWVALPNGQVSDGVSSRASICYSLDDGATWTRITPNLYPTLGQGAQGVGYSKETSRWIVLAGAGPGYYSDTGTSWTAIPGLPATRGANWKVVYGKGVWVASGSFVTATGTETHGIMASTDNGLNWSNVGPAGFQALFANYGGGKFVAVGTVHGSTAKRIAFSNDGQTWTLVPTSVMPSPDWSNMMAVAYLGNHQRWIIVGTADGAASPPVYGVGLSPDGETWNWVRNVSGVFHCTYLANLPQGGMIGVNNSGLIFTTQDGVTWYRRSQSAHANGSYWGIGINDRGRIMISGENFGGSPTPQAILINRGFKTFASEADLLDDDASMVPDPGTYGVYLSASGSYFRLGAQPAGQITSDVIEGTAAADRTVAQIYKRALDDRMGKASGDWSAADVTALDAAANYVVGFWTDQETQFSTLFDQLAESLGASWYIDKLGVFRIAQLLAPSGSPVRVFTANDLLAPIERVTLSDVGDGLPTYETIVRHTKNYSPQINDLAANVTVTRRAFLAKEFREAKATDSAVKTKHLLAPQWGDNSLLTATANAQSEATRRQTLRGLQRHLYRIVVQWNDANAPVDVNSVVGLEHVTAAKTRYSLSAGSLFRVLGVKANARARRLTFTVWGRGASE